MVNGYNHSRIQGDQILIRRFKRMNELPSNLMPELENFRSAVGITWKVKKSVRVSRLHVSDSILLPYGPLKGEYCCCGNVCGLGPGRFRLDQGAFTFVSQRYIHNAGVLDVGEIDARDVWWHSVLDKLLLRFAKQSRKISRWFVSMIHTHFKGVYIGIEFPKRMKSGAVAMRKVTRADAA